MTEDATGKPIVDTAVQKHGIISIVNRLEENCCDLGVLGVLARGKLFSLRP